MLSCIQEAPKKASGVGRKYVAEFHFPTWFFSRIGLAAYGCRNNLVAVIVQRNVPSFLPARLLFVCSPDAKVNFLASQRGLGFPNATHTHSVLQTCYKRWRLGCVNSATLLLLAAGAFSRNLYFGFYLISVLRLPPFDFVLFESFPNCFRELTVVACSHLWLKLDG